jgi:hypothetical protein
MNQLSLLPESPEPPRPGKPKREAETQIVDRHLHRQGHRP